MRRRLRPVVAGLVGGIALLVAPGCSDDSGDDARDAAPSTSRAPEVTGSTSTTAVVYGFEGTCPFSEAEVSALLGTPMASQDRRPAGCRFERRELDGSARLAVVLDVSWEPRAADGSSTLESGSSTSQSGDAGRHRTATSFETDRWQGTLELTYEWSGRAAPDFEAGADAVRAAAAAIDGAVGAETAMGSKTAMGAGPAS